MGVGQEYIQMYRTIPIYRSANTHPNSESTSLIVDAFGTYKIFRYKRTREAFIKAKNKAIKYIDKHLGNMKEGIYRNNKNKMLYQFLRLVMLKAGDTDRPAVLYRDSQEGLYVRPLTEFEEKFKWQFTSHSDFETIPKIILP